jgi:general secretion pathway protein K
VLWSLCLLTTFAVILGYGVRQKLSLASRIDERDKLHFIVGIGAERAILELKNEPEKTYDVFKDNWSSNTNAFKDIDIGDARINICYNYINEPQGLVEVRYGLIDEERKININKAEVKVLERFFRIALNYNENQAQELAASIVDWRDSDSELSVPLGSAEDSYYRDLEQPYEAKDAVFEILEELLLVRGIREDSFQKIKDYLTVYGSGRININTVSKPVLLALGLSDDITGKILNFRSGEDGILGTDDDNVFDQTANILPKLSQFYDLSESEVAALSAVVSEYLTTKSNIFMAKSTARLNGKNYTEELTCVFDRKGKILYWQEQ